MTHLPNWERNMRVPHSNAVLMSFTISGPLVYILTPLLINKGQIHRSSTFFFARNKYNTADIKNRHDYVCGFMKFQKQNEWEDLCMQLIYRSQIGSSTLQ